MNSSNAFISKPLSRSKTLSQLNSTSKTKDHSFPSHPIFLSSMFLTQLCWNMSALFFNPRYLTALIVLGLGDVEDMIHSPCHR